MTRDEIIRMAQEAGFIGKWEQWYKEYVAFATDAPPEEIESYLTRFAELAYQSGRNAGLKEAAEVCDEKSAHNREDAVRYRNQGYGVTANLCDGKADTANNCATAIRARIGNEIMGGGDE